jgi:hypothetical protein
MRESSASFINGATNLSVTVDGIPIKKLRRVQSEVFTVALPKDNVFVAFNICGDLKAGIYSPAVDDGIYVLVDPLDVGTHALHIHAENPEPSFKLDVLYTLNVVAF